MDWTYALIAAHVNETFVFVGEGEVEVPVTLVSATPSPAGGSLIFTGTPERAMTQGAYPVRHETLGVGLLFVVPIGQDATTSTYETIFN